MSRPTAVLGDWVAPESAYARGQAMRESVPHQAHRDAIVSPDRPSVARFVRASNRGRLPDLVPLRIGRMAASPFSFLRGSAGLMAADLAGTPVSGLNAQICGDAHVANLGLYGAPDGEVVMDFTDFDETVLGPWEWDLKRLATSLVLAGRVGGVSEHGCAKAAEDAVLAYRSVMGALADRPFMDSWTTMDGGPKASRVKTKGLLADLTAAKSVRRGKKDRWRFVPAPGVLDTVDTRTASAVVKGLGQYLDTLHESPRNLITRYSVCDVAFHMGGTSGVGLRDYLVLLRGNRDEPLILQVKEARPSALNPYLGLAPAAHEGERIVCGARLVQAETDLLLGWTRIGGRAYLVRRFRDRKGKIDPTMVRRKNLDDYGRLAGALLAHSHARSIDPRLIAGYCMNGEKLDRGLVKYAQRYADQTEQDHADLVAAVRAGQLPATTESAPA